MVGRSRATVNIATPLQ